MLLAVLIVLRNLTVFTISFVQEANVSDFDDFGTLLFGGFVLAIVVAVAFTFVKLRLRDKKRPQGEFISISSLPKEK
jgi:hypothetical protein